MYRTSCLSYPVFMKKSANFNSKMLSIYLKIIINGLALLNTAQVTVFFRNLIHGIDSKFAMGSCNSHEW